MATQLPKGFQSAGVAAGVKESGSLDISLIYSEAPCSTAGVYTQNRVVGAPVIVSRERTPRATGRAVVINSGNANACTGDQGLADAKRMTAIVAEQFDIVPEDVLICSTGIIGHFLPMEKIEAGIRSASSQIGMGESDLENAAKAMMTTDTFPKLSSRSIDVDGTSVTVTGIAKGAAMIAPNMATMLGVILLDGAISPEVAQSFLKQAVDQSFNNIIVEGHTSTSDTVLLFANGKSGANIESAAAKELVQSAVNEVAAELAQMIIRDAEGAGHFVTVHVSGLPTEADARKIAKAICEGPLVKTAITGNDPNWGRIVSAAGYAGVEFLEKDVSLDLNGTTIYKEGTPIDYDEQALSASMKTGEVVIDLRFTLGDAKVTYWTCDLTQEYIRLNADYTT